MGTLQTSFKQFISVQTMISMIVIIICNLMSKIPVGGQNLKVHCPISSLRASSVTQSVVFRRSTTLNLNDRKPYMEEYGQFTVNLCGGVILEEDVPDSTDQVVREENK